MDFKPRKTNFFGTRLKHTGTILRHPQQYYRYKKHKAAFIRENHLPMNDHYDVERQGPAHMYPGMEGRTIRDGGVIYPGGDHAQTQVHQDVDLMRTDAFDHQATRGVPAADLGTNVRNRGVESRGQPTASMVVLRQEVADTAPVLRTAAKRGAHTSDVVDHRDIGRTQHSTLTGAENVAAAAIKMSAVDALGIDEGGVGPAVEAAPAYIAMSSGHYRPEEGGSAAVKLAIAGKTGGNLNRRVTEFKEGGYFGDDHSVDLTMKRRMKVVSDWAKGPPRPSLLTRFNAWRRGYRRV